MAEHRISLHRFTLGPHRLAAVMRMPDQPRGLILFAHGSGSSHQSPRNNHVAERLAEAGFASLLFDLLTPAEEEVRANVFDIGLLSARLVDAIARMRGEEAFADLPIGLFGASTGAGAALRAAADSPVRVAAVVSRGGRPDLAGGDALAAVTCPVQLIVGSRDTEVIALNRAAARLLGGPTALVIIPGAGHLFEEPGTMDEMIAHARDWFVQHLAPERAVP